MERREWWAVGNGVSVTLLVTLALSTFVLPTKQFERLFSFFSCDRRCEVWWTGAGSMLHGLSYLQIHRMRPRLFKGELFPA